MADSETLLYDENFLSQVSEKVYEQTRKRLRSDLSENEEEAAKQTIDSEISKALAQIQLNIASQTDAIRNLTTKADETNDALSSMTKVVTDNKKGIENLRVDLDVIRAKQHEQLEQIKTDVKQQRIEGAKTKSDVEVMKRDMAALKRERADVKRKMIDLEARSRRNNLLFFGVQEERDENAEKTLRKFLKERLDIQAEPHIQRVHRLGRPLGSSVIGKAAGRPRPLIACFTDYNQKELIRAKRFTLQAPFGIAEDLPGEIREARKLLAPVMKELKTQGKKVALAYPCKLFVEGNLDRYVDIVDNSIHEV